MKKQWAVAIFLLLNLLAVASMRDLSAPLNWLVSGGGSATPALPVLPEK